MASSGQPAARGRARIALVVAALVTWAGCGLFVPPAQAEPVATASYRAGASADVIGISTNLVGLSVADLRLAHSSAGADSGTGATATSSNVDAALLGALSIPVSSSSVAVPASQASSQTKSGSLTGVNLNLALQAQLAALSYDQQATWNGAACLPNGTYVSRGNAAAAGLAVGVLGTPIVSTGEVSVTSTTGTSPSSAVHDTRRTTAVAQGRVAGLSLLNGAVTVSALDPVMSTASGSTTATISSSAVTVTTGGSTVTLLPGQTLNLTPGIGQSVSLTLAPTSISGVAGSYGTTFLTVRVSVVGLATVDLDVLPLSVSAVAPSTSLECDTAASIDISSPTAGQTVNATPTISGTSDIPNGTLSLVLDGRAAVPVSTDPVGAWTYTPTVPLADGARTAVVSGTDAAGNAANASRTFTVDSTGPALTISTPAAGAITADATPTISGTSDILDGAVAVALDGRPAVSVDTDAAGDWTYTPSVPLADGPRTVVVTGTDGVGNLTSRSRSFAVDTTATVSISAPAQGSTIAQRRPTITGTSDLLSGQLSLVLDGLSPTTVSTDASGDWNYPVPVDLADGSHTVQVSGTDPVGNPATDSVTFGVDGTAPVLTVDAPADGVTLADPAPTIAGTSDQPNATVSLQIDAQPAVSVPTDSTGGWTYTPADLADGSHTVTVTATDGVGNLGTDSSTFSIDTHAEIIIDAPAEGATIAQPRPGITGRSDILNSTVTLTLDGVPTSVSTASSGAWSFTPGVDLSDGPHTVTVTGSDVAAHPASDTVTFTVDTTAPQVAILTPADGSSSNVVQPSIAGTSDLPSATLQLAIDGAAPASVTTEPDGTWSYPTPAPLAAGDHMVAVTGVDPAGNVGGDVSTFTIDTTDPSVAITTPAQGAQLSEATPTISGTSADAGGTVQIRIDGGAPIPVGTGPDGGWTTTSPPLLDGPHTVTASVADAAGNTASASRSFTVAATAPEVRISTPVDGASIAEASPQISGGSNVAAGQVSVRIDGAAPVLVPTDGTGDWTHPAPVLADGPHTVEVSLTTLAGTATDQVSFTVDTRASLTIASPADGSLLGTATPQVRGSSDAPNSTVRLVVDAEPEITVVTDNLGDWAWTPPASGLADGAHTFAGSVTDAAGNTPAQPCTSPSTPRHRWWASTIRPTAA